MDKCAHVHGYMCTCTCTCTWIDMYMYMYMDGWIMLCIFYMQSKESKKNIAKKYISLLLSSLHLEILYAVPILRFNVLLRLPRLIRVCVCVCVCLSVCLSVCHFNIISIGSSVLPVYQSIREFYKISTLF